MKTVNNINYYYNVHYISSRLELDLMKLNQILITHEFLIVNA